MLKYWLFSQNCWVLYYKTIKRTPTLTKSNLLITVLGWENHWCQVFCWANNWNGCQCLQKIRHKDTTEYEPEIFVFIRKFSLHLLAYFCASVYVACYSEDFTTLNPFWVNITLEYIFLFSEKASLLSLTEGWLVFFVVNFGCLDQCLPTFSCSRHPYLVIKIFGGTPNWYYRYKDQEIITIGGTLVCGGTPVGNHWSIR